MQAPIPPFTTAGLLPPGIHWAEWQQIQERFGYTSYRNDLLLGMMDGLSSLKISGCKKIYIDGSFCTSKEIPGDFDVCWDDDQVDFALLKNIAPLFFDFSAQRAGQKARYRGEFFPCNAAAILLPTTLYLDFFQQDKNSGQRKGIIGLQL